MEMLASIMGDRAEEYTGKRGLVKQRILTVMDKSEKGERLLQPVEYAMSDEEKIAHPTTLQDKLGVFGFRELSAFGTKLRARGKLVSVVGK